MLWHIITVNKMVKIGLQPYIHLPPWTVHVKIKKKKKKKKESQSITGISFIENIGLCIS